MRPIVTMLDPQWDSIIDVEDGHLLYAARLKGLAFRFIGSGMAFRPREAPDGTHYLKVVGLRLCERFVYHSISFDSE